MLSIGRILSPFNSAGRVRNAATGTHKYVILPGVLTIRAPSREYGPSMGHRVVPRSMGVVGSLFIPS